MVERVDIKIGYLCNNRCRFCVQGNKREIYGNKSGDEVKAILEKAREDSDSIVFTGGELTIRKDVLELVRFAKSLRFKKIQIQTNGRMLAYKKFCEELINAGANEFSPALHGHIPEIHDYLTRSTGSFKQTYQGIKNLKELNAFVLTNSVITRSNYRHLPELSDLLISLDVDQFQFAFPHPVGSAGENFFSIVPRFSLIEHFVKEGLKKGIKAKKKVMTEAIPYCFMKGFENYVAEEIIPRTKIFEDRWTIDDYTEFRIKEGKIKGKICEKCHFNILCEGVWKEYPENYGWEEFVSEKE